jgi:hypothetical protein
MPVLVEVELARAPFLCFRVNAFNSEYRRWSTKRFERWHKRPRCLHSSQFRLLPLLKLFPKKSAPSTSRISQTNIRSASDITAWRGRHLKEKTPTKFRRRSGRGRSAHGIQMRLPRIEYGRAKITKLIGRKAEVFIKSRSTAANRCRSATRSWRLAAGYHWPSGSGRVSHPRGRWLRFLPTRCDVNRRC